MVNITGIFALSGVATIVPFSAAWFVQVERSYNAVIVGAAGALPEGMELLRRLPALSDDALSTTRQ
ncbi:hypothetical protein [Methylobacterium sp. WL9]|uniref:hypothetical protein n=1 Tax=Methylobacterium sp. WL9 TaxID=2603898 RepID=UPI001AEEF93C|nr:hypothetical protein [Methylobacterium sp. WL9]